MTDFSPLLDPLQLNLNPICTSPEKIEEKINNTPGIFDIPPSAVSRVASVRHVIYFNLSLGGQTFYTLDPVRFSMEATHIGQTISGIDIIGTDSVKNSTVIMRIYL